MREIKFKKLDWSKKDSSDTFDDDTTWSPIYLTNSIIVMPLDYLKNTNTIPEFLFGLFGVIFIGLVYLTIDLFILPIKLLSIPYLEKKKQ